MHLILSPNTIESIPWWAFFQETFIILPCARPCTVNTTDQKKIPALLVTGTSAHTLRLPKSQFLQTKRWPHPHTTRVNPGDTPPETNKPASLATLTHSLGPGVLSHSGPDHLGRLGKPSERPLPRHPGGETTGGSAPDAPRAHPARAPSALRPSRAGAGAAAALLASGQQAARGS